MQKFEVDGWRIDVDALTATKGDVQHHLPNKAMHLLQLLAENQGQVVNHETIEKVVWEGNSFVAKKAASNTVWQLRKALQDGDQPEAFIETIPKRGYLLNALVEPIETGSEASDKRRLGMAMPVVATVVLIGLLTMFWFVGRSPEQVQYERLILTDYPGEETEPALSKDGRRLAFIWSGPGRDADVYWKFVEEEGAPPRQVTKTVANEAKPTWSPDGKRLAYVRIQPDTRACEVYVHTLAAATEERLVECQATIPGTLDWSPDGQYIAFTYKDETPENLGHGIAVIDVKSRAVKRLTRSPNIDFVDTDVAWSPDSLRLVHTRRNAVEQDEIHIIDLDGNAVSLPEAPTDLFGVSWAKNADELIVAAIPEGEHRRQLLRISADTGAMITKLDQGALEAYVPDQAFDLDLIAYDASNLVVGVGTVTNGDETVSKLPVISSLSTDREPTVAPDMKSIAFTSMRSGAKEIWLHREGALVPEQLTALGVSSVFGPAWSPDGDHLTFLAPGDTGNLHIHMLRLADRAIWQVTKDATDHMPPSWSPDGKSLLSARKLDNVWTIHRHHLDRDNKLSSVETVAPGYIAKEHAEGGLYIFRLTDNAIFKWREAGAELFWADFERRDWGNWSVGEKGVYGLRRLEEGLDSIKVRAHDSLSTIVVSRLPASNVFDQNSLSMWPDEGGFHVAYYEMQQADIFALREK